MAGFLIHLLLFLTIASFPLYLFPSGGIQISHVLFSIFCLFFFIVKGKTIFKIDKKIKPIFRALGAFVLLACIVQGSWAAIHGDYFVLIFPGFYVFNVTYLIVIYAYLRNYKDFGVSLVFFAMLTSVGLVFVGLVAGVSVSSYRRTSFFNNPNQLGYFALLASIIILLFHTRFKFKYSRVLSMGAVLINLYLSSVSLSKAAMVSTAVAIACFLPIFKKTDLAIMTLIVAVTFPFWLPKVTGSDVYAKAALRMERIGADKDDSVFGRGYGRIMDHPEQLFLGAGEGNVGRWGEEIELHSMFGNTLFCYGFLGLTIILIFFFRCFMVSPIVFTILFAPVFAYCLTHNGIRFSYMWMLLAIYIYMETRPVERTRKSVFLTGKYINAIAPNRALPAKQQFSNQYPYR